MENLVFTMESTCDLPEEIVKQRGFVVLDMDFVVDGKEFSSKTDTAKSSGIYQKMREGKRTSTSQINQFLYEEAFQKLLDQGKTIIHIGFSSGLSGSLSNAIRASETMNKEQKKVFVVDSIVGSTGQGMLAMLVDDFAKTCDDPEKIAEFATEKAKTLNAYFTVDNLKYLATGGRISRAKAVVGNLLSIKPIIRANNEGKLENGEKVISRKKSLHNLANKFLERHIESNPQVFVCHADSFSDAQIVADLIFEKSGITANIHEIGPVMGSHCGPGTIAIFFWADKRI